MTGLNMSLFVDDIVHGWEILNTCNLAGTYNIAKYIY